MPRDSWQARVRDRVTQLPPPGSGVQGTNSPVGLAYTLPSIGMSCVSVVEATSRRPEG